MSSIGIIEPRITNKEPDCVKRVIETTGPVLTSTAFLRPQFVALEPWLMSSPESKRALLEGQVNSKIYWGATRTEVTDWLEMEKGVSAADAEQLVRNALRIRSATIRRRAVMTLVCSTVGVLIAAGFVALSGPGLMRRAWYLAVAIGTPSVVLLLKSIVHIARGDSDEPLE